MSEAKVSDIAVASRVIQFRGDYISIAFICGSIRGTAQTRSLPRNQHQSWCEAVALESLEMDCMKKAQLPQSDEGSLKGGGGGGGGGGWAEVVVGAAIELISRHGTSFWFP